MNGVSERELLAAKFDDHAEEEGKILAEYRVLSDKLGRSAVGVLIDMILTEEEIHHLLLRTTAKWLREPPVEEEDMGPQKVDRDELLSAIEAASSGARSGAGPFT